MSTVTLASKRRRSALRTLAFMSPWLIGFAVFFAYPLLSTVDFSFMHYDGFKPPTWSGTKNWTTSSSTTRCSGPRCATPCGWCWSWSACGSSSDSAWAC